MSMSRSPAPSVYLHVINHDFQWPIHDHAIVELRDIVTRRTVAEFPVALVIAALAHYVTGAALTADLLQEPRAIAPLRELTPAAPSRAPLRAVGVPLRNVQAARRAARASRKRPEGR